MNNSGKELTVQDYVFLWLPLVILTFSIPLSYSFLFPQDWIANITLASISFTIGLLLFAIVLLGTFKKWWICFYINAVARCLTFLVLLICVVTVIIMNEVELFETSGGDYIALIGGMSFLFALFCIPLTLHIFLLVSLIMFSFKFGTYYRKYYTPTPTFNEHSFEMTEQFQGKNVYNSDV